MKSKMGVMPPAATPETRDASGTSWQPDSTPIYAYHTLFDTWKLMTHFNAFVAYDKQWGGRGDDQFNSMNWFMLMASHPVAEGDLMLRGMLSLEPATATKEGYPLLFQSGETFHGRPLVDRQHPHDFFMELAARYRYPLGEKTALSLYLAPSGEPSLGPPAFPHRVSAMDNPAAPITHHWMDSAHISFGVATLGLSHDKFQIEGSIFNGREPDEERWDIDPISLDSYSGRLSYNPAENWSFQTSYGYLKSPEELRPKESVRRTTVSAIYNRPMDNGGNWATSLLWGMNNEAGINSNGLLLESNFNIGNKNTVFGRIEYVQKTGEELVIQPEHKKFDLTALSLGASHELSPGKPYSVAIGTSVTYTFKPSSLDERYGDTPVGFWVFIRIRPALMQHGGFQMGHGGD